LFNLLSSGGTSALLIEQRNRLRIQYTHWIDLSTDGGRQPVLG